jgi:hypothetical protein
MRLAALFGQWLEVGRRGREVQKTACGGWPDLWPGEKKLPTAQDGAHHARDAPWNRGLSQGREASDLASPDA